MEQLPHHKGYEQGNSKTGVQQVTLQLGGARQKIWFGTDEGFLPPTFKNHTHISGSNSYRNNLQ